jgi:hypothetical protein
MLSIRTSRTLRSRPVLVARYSSPGTRRPVLVAFVLFALAFASSCGDDQADADPECGGHGELHDDERHCDSGYRVDPEDSTQCIPE